MECFFDFRVEQNRSGDAIIWGPLNGLAEIPTDLRCGRAALAADPRDWLLENYLERHNAGGGNHLANVKLSNC